jgi:hypothetical protein
MKMIEVGKTYKNGEGNDIEIVHIIDKSRFCTWPILGAVHYESGVSNFASYTLEGVNISDPDSPYNLVLENEDD